MERRHLLEERHQHQALKEGVDRESFRPLLEEIFGPLRSSGPGRIDSLVGVFKDPLVVHRYRLPMGTLVVDSSVVRILRHLNSREENATLKNGGVPFDWKNQSSTLCQKDTDARGLKKHGLNPFG